MLYIIKGRAIDGIVFVETVDADLNVQSWTGEGSEAQRFNAHDSLCVIQNYMETPRMDDLESTVYGLHRLQIEGVT